MQTNPEKVVGLTDEMLRLVELEGLTAKVGEMYGELANVFYFMDDLPNAKKFATLALDYWLVFDGVDQKHVNNIRAFLAQLE